MKWRSIGLLFLAAGLAACSLVPKSAPLISLRSNLAKTPIDGQGFLAFVPVSTTTDVELNLVVRKIGTDQRFKLRLNPPFANRIRSSVRDTGTPDSIAYPGMINRKAAIYVLPPGRYVTLYKHYKIPFVRKNGSGGKGLLPDTFELTKGRIAALGFIQSGYNSSLFGANGVWLRVVGSDIDSILANSRDSVLSKAPIIRTPLRLDDSPDFFPSL